MIQSASLVGIGGAAGAICRYAVGRRLTHDWVPVGTLAVNALGSFLLGLAVFSGLGGDLSLFFAVGFCGSLTTYSSFSLDTVQLWTTAPRRAIVYVVLMSVSCLCAVGLAAGIARLG